MQNRRQLVYKGEEEEEEEGGGVCFEKQIHSHLHVSETLDAKQRLVLGGEQDVGLLVERCRDRDAFKLSVQRSLEVQVFCFSNEPVCGKQIAEYTVQKTKCWLIFFLLEKCKTTLQSEMLVFF